MDKIMRSSSIRSTVIVIRRSILIRASEDARADRRRSACCGRTIRERVTRGLNAHGGADFSPSWNAIRGMRVVEEM